MKGCASWLRSGGDLARHPPSFLVAAMPATLPPLSALTASILRGPSCSRKTELPLATIGKAWRCYVE